MAGEQNNNWKGGINPINDTIRKSMEFKNWRIAIFERDNYTCKNPNCIHCNNIQGRVLHAHHIKSFAKYPELRFDVENGLTLCEDFHLKNHLHGGGD